MLSKLSVFISLTLAAVSTLTSPLPEITPERPATFSLAIGGDVLLASTVGERIKIQGVNYPWEDAAPFLCQADLAIVNLETSVAQGGTAQKNKTYTFRAAPETLQGLTTAGVDIVALANNHILDYGQEGLTETLDHLNSYQIQHTGAGHNAAAAYKSVSKKINDTHFAFLSFSMVVPPGWQAGAGYPGIAAVHDLEKTLAAVKTAAQRADFVLVYMHWGIERQDLPNKPQQEIARALIKAGADLVVGCHPHVLQGIEFYQGVPICYSLGNFVFTNRGLQTTEDTILLLAEAGQSGVRSLQAVPFEIIKNKPTLVAGSDRERILKRLARLSAQLGTEITPAGEIKLKTQDP
ncbi:MAG: CapA family protein [Peptococcaceae bacterium]